MFKSFVVVVKTCQKIFFCVESIFQLDCHPFNELVHNNLNESRFEKIVWFVFGNLHLHLRQIRHRHHLPGVFVRESSSKPKIFPSCATDSWRQLFSSRPLSVRTSYLEDSTRLVRLDPVARRASCCRRGHLSQERSQTEERTWV